MSCLWGRKSADLISEHLFHHPMVIDKSVGLKPFHTIGVVIIQYISSSTPKKKPFSQEELWIPFL